MGQDRWHGCGEWKTSVYDQVVHDVVCYEGEWCPAILESIDEGYLNTDLREGRQRWGNRCIELLTGNDDKS